MKVQLRRSADKVNDPLRIVDPWKLNNNSVLALPLNTGFGRSEFIDAAADNFNGLGHGSELTVSQDLLRQGDAKSTAFLILKHDIRGCCGNRSPRVRHFGWIWQCQGDRIATNRKITVADFGIS
jgi:hypothetical protein